VSGRTGRLPLAAVVREQAVSSGPVAG